jgi:hypothetical protein
MLSGKLRKGGDAVDRLWDARLHIVVAIGLPILGWLFSSCWNAEGGNFYTASGYPFCVDFEAVSAFSLFPLKWIVAASVCVVLFSVYRIWTEENSN